MKDIKQIEYFFIEKFLLNGLHLASNCFFWNPRIKPFLTGFRNNFGVLNPEVSTLYFRRSLKFLLKVLLSKKKVLFIGAPLGLEKEFSTLCVHNYQYILEKEVPGIITNFQKSSVFLNNGVQKLTVCPSLVFIISTPKNSIIITEISKLGIPIMGFLSTDDFMKIDFPLPANTKSLKGSFFVYNFFFHLFKVTKFIRSCKGL